MAVEYPHVGFHFRVTFEEIQGGSTLEAGFQEVTGLTVKMETEEVAEGGENRYKLKLPTRNSFGEITLKRAFYVDNAISDWALDALEAANDFDFDPMHLTIDLLDENHDTMAQWRVQNAWPTQLQISDLKSEDNGIVVETLTLTYQFFNRKL